MAATAVSESTATELQVTKSFVFIQFTARGLIRVCPHSRLISDLGQGRVRGAGSFREKKPEYRSQNTEEGGATRIASLDSWRRLGPMASRRLAPLNAEVRNGRGVSRRDASNKCSTSADRKSV